MSRDNSDNSGCGCIVIIIAAIFIWSYFAKQDERIKELENKVQQNGQR